MGLLWIFFQLLPKLTLDTRVEKHFALDLCYKFHCVKITPMHDDVIKLKHFPRNWPFVRGIHRSPVNSPHKGQWRVALMFSLIWVWINGSVNNRKAGDLRRYRFHYDVTVMGIWMYKVLDSTNIMIIYPIQELSIRWIKTKHKQSFINRNH